MRTLRSACAVLATLFACAIGAAPAIADTVVIDSVDSPSSVFQPPNVTIDVGDTVRWEFDAAATTHTVTSTQFELVASTRSRGPNGAPIERTFNTAGVYTFLCTLHTGMTGSITVEAPALDRVLVFSKTGGFRHDSIPQGIAAIQALGTANDFDGRRHRGRGRVHGREPRHLRRRRLHVDDRRDPQRHPAGRVRALHPGRRRLRRRPRGLRHRVLLAVVRRVGRRLLPQPPARNAAGDGRDRGRQRALDDRPAGALGAHGRVVQLPAPGDPGRSTAARRSPTTARAPARCRCSPRSTSRPTTSRTATRSTTTTRSRGARTSTAAAPGTRRMGHTQASFADAEFRSHLLGGLRTAAGVAGDCGERARHAADRRGLREDHDQQRHERPDGDRHRQ